MRSRLGTLFALWAALASPGFGGEIYEWVDERRVIHYTDDRELVPEPFRASVRISEAKGEGSFQRIIERRVPSALAAPAAPDESPGGRTEAQWRSDAERLDALVSKLAPAASRCASDHVNSSPGDGSRKRKAERAEAEACAQTRSDLLNARAERDELREAAHRVGVPPGWVREP